MKPTITDYNATTAVIFIGFFFGIVTTSFHARPSAILWWIVSSTMRKAMFPWLAQKTSATFDVSSNQVTGANDVMQGSTSALTIPAGLPSFTIGDTFERCQLSKYLILKPQSLHAIDFNIKN